MFTFKYIYDVYKLNLFFRIFDIWRTHASLNLVSDTATAEASANPSLNIKETDETDSQTFKIKKSRMESAFIANILAGHTVRNSTKDELNEYDTEDFEPSNCNPSDVLLYWAGKKKKSPRLSTMARDMLSIPATSVASEKAFSTGKDVFDISRMRLNPENVEAVLCLRSWYRPSLLEEADVHEFVHEH